MTSAGATPRSAARAADPRGILVVTSTLFVALGAFAAIAGLLPADVALRDAALALATPPVVTAMSIINAAGDWRLLLPGTLALMAFPQARRTWWLWGLLMLLATVAPDAFKWLIGRPRPEALSLGFPSGHATAAAAFFGALAYLAGALPPRGAWLVRAAALALIVLVGAARVVLRAHWPSDVLGGIALGLALASAAVLVHAACAADSHLAGARARQGAISGGRVESSQ